VTFITASGSAGPRASPQPLVQATGIHRTPRARATRPRRGRGQ